MTQQTVGQFVSLSGYFSEAWLYKCKNLSQLTVIHIKTMTMQTGIFLSSYSHSDTRLLCRYRSIPKTILDTQEHIPALIPSCRLVSLRLLTQRCNLGSDTKLSRPNPNTTNCSTGPEYEDGFQNVFPKLITKSLGSALKNWPKFQKSNCYFIKAYWFSKSFQVVKENDVLKIGFFKNFSMPVILIFSFAAEQML